MHTAEEPHTIDQWLKYWVATTGLGQGDDSRFLAAHRAYGNREVPIYSEPDDNRPEQHHHNGQNGSHHVDQEARQIRAFSSRTQAKSALYSDTIAESGMIEYELLYCPDSPPPNALVAEQRWHFVRTVAAQLNRCIVRVKSEAKLAHVNSASIVAILRPLKDKLALVEGEIFFLAGFGKFQTQKSKERQQRFFGRLRDQRRGQR